MIKLLQAFRRTGQRASVQPWSAERGHWAAVVWLACVGTEATQAATVVGWGERFLPYVAPWMRLVAIPPGFERSLASRYEGLAEGMRYLLFSRLCIGGNFGSTGRSVAAAFASIHVALAPAEKGCFAPNLLNYTAPDR